MPSPFRPACFLRARMRAIAVADSLRCFVTLRALSADSAFFNLRQLSSEARRVLAQGFAEPNLDWPLRQDFTSPIARNEAGWSQRADSSASTQLDRGEFSFRADRLFSMLDVASAYHSWQSNSCGVIKYLPNAYQFSPMLFECEVLEAIEPDGLPGLLRIVEEVIKFVPTALRTWSAGPGCAMANGVSESEFRVPANPGHRSLGCWYRVRAGTNRPGPDQSTMRIGPRSDAGP